MSGQTTMKILIIRTFPDIMDINAYNVQEIGLAKALTMKGHQCDIVLYNGSNKSKEEVCTFMVPGTGHIYSYKIYWLHGFNLVKNGIMPSLTKIIQKYDVLQVDEYNLFYSWLLYTRQLKPTVIYHGLYYSDYTRGYNLKCAVFDRIILPLRHYKDVFAITKSKMAGDFLSAKGFQNVCSVGVGVDPDNFAKGDAEKKSELLSKKEKFRLLYVGKIEDRRNSLWLLDVFFEILKRNFDVELVVIGKGEKGYTDRFLKKADSFIKESRMIYYSKVTQNELAQIYPQCDVFLFPSQYEIFGMVLLEAMYFGMPVVSSYNGGSSTLIEDNNNGIIVRGFDAKEWADKITELLNNYAKRREMGRKAGETIRENYLWEKISDRFLEVYYQAIDAANKKKK